MKNKVISLSLEVDIVDYFKNIRSKESQPANLEKDVYTIGEALETLEENSRNEGIKGNLTQLKEAFTLYNRESFWIYADDVLRQIYEIVLLCESKDNETLKNSLIDIANDIIQIYIQ